MKIGILTGGGDCPGLNAVIRAVVRRADQLHWTVLGFRNGWRGVLEKDTVPLNIESVSGILPKGGTILGTSRTNIYKKPEDAKRAIDNLKSMQLDALIAIGGEDTLGVASKLHQEGVPVVGVPKTIDNDLNETDFTFGFDTAVNIATEAIDRLHTTAESHHRIMVVEVMGRHAGWIATYAGLAGGADLILIPEQPIDMAEVVRVLRARCNRGKNFSIVVVSEGANFKDGDMITKDAKTDSFGHVTLGGIGQMLSERIEAETGYETRVTVLGHIQRGGTPSALDRVLATRYGLKAVELVEQKLFGHMVSLQGNKVVPVPLSKATGQLKTVDMELYNLAKTFFG